MILLGLGSNLGDREQNIMDAIGLLAKHKDISIDKVSALYETEPFGVREQPDYLNAVVSIITILSPFELLEVCHAVEQSLGRVRIKRWEARIIDIDILVYHNVKVDTDHLTIPHPYLHKRNFVLIPLNEIANHIPVYNGMKPTELLQVGNDDSKVTFYKRL